MTKEKAQTVLDCLRIMIPILEEAVGFNYKTPCCKDCKHGIPDREDGKIMGYECDLLYNSYWGADDFCSRGELK